MIKHFFNAEIKTDAPNVLLLETRNSLIFKRDQFYLGPTDQFIYHSTTYGFNEIDIKDFVELLTKFPIKRDAFRMKMHWVSKYSQILRV